MTATNAVRLAKTFFVAGIVLPIAIALIVMFSVKDFVRRPKSPATRTDTASAAAWRQANQAKQLAAAAAGERDGLKAKVAQLELKLRGIEARAPRTVIYYDTIIDVRHDTIALPVNVSGRGRLDYSILIPVADSLHRPVTFKDFDVSDCDDGFSIAGPRVVCNRARLGHLTIIARAGVLSHGEVADLNPLGEVGLRWTPALRSTFAIEGMIDNAARRRLMVEKGLRLF